MGILSLSEESVGEFLLIMSSIMFSMSFVGSRYAMVDAKSTIGPWTFNALRYSVSFCFLFILEPMLRKHPIFKFPDPMPESVVEEVEKTLRDANGSLSSINGVENGQIDNGIPKSAVLDPNININSGTLSFSRISKKMLQIILIQGSSNFIASILLQIGLKTLDVSKAAFITSTYVVVIPFVECFLPVIAGQKFECLSTKIWVEVLICIIGVYLISGCVGNVSCFGSVQDNGEMFVISSVVFWVINIMICDEAGKFHDSILLTLGDFVVVALLTITCSLIFESSSWVYPFSDILTSWKVILFVGIVEAFAYLLSTVGQIYVRPSRSAIIYSGESLFTSLGGFLFLGEVLTPPELLGGALICLSSVLTSLSFVGDDEEEEEEEEEVEEISTDQLAETGRTEAEPKKKRGSLDLRDHSPLIGPPRTPRQPPQLTFQQRQDMLQEQLQLRYLPQYMQMRRQRGGSISRYPLFRSKPYQHFECTRPIPIASPSVTPAHNHDPVPHYGSLPMESNMDKYYIQMQQLSSSL